MWNHSELRLTSTSHYDGADETNFEKPLYGHWMIAELQRHGYKIGPGTMYRLLHRLAREGYLLRKQQRSD
jgi:hypothetical protein